MRGKLRADISQLFTTAGIVLDITVVDTWVQHKLETFVLSKNKLCPHFKYEVYVATVENGKLF